MRESVLLTCDHGGHRVPLEYASLFAEERGALKTHRGWDPGALDLAQSLEGRFGWPLVACTVTRLLVDVNRSTDHAGIFSEFTRGLPAKAREEILAAYYRPYRDRVRAAVKSARCTLHLALHSFTPVWNGRTRDTDVGILHDPARPREREFSLRWKACLQRARPDLRVHLNRPYRGWTDGLPTTLREQFPDARYAGIEVEVSQRFPVGKAATWRALRESLAASLAEALGARAR
jgi:predicted N-formylglutamate amidohydrolase